MMARLDDIQEQLYKDEKERISARPYAPSNLKPEDASAKPHPDTAPKKWSGARVFELSKGNSKLLWGGAAFLVVLLLFVSGFAIWDLLFSFDKEKVLMRVRNIEQITSGDEVLYKVEIGNTNRIRLEDAELVFTYPEGSFSFGGGDGLLPVSTNSSEARILLGDIDPGEQLAQEFSARMIGAERDTRFATAKLTFTPSSINRRLSRQEKSPVTIANVPIVITIDAPNESLSNKEVFYTINYVNTSNIAFEDLQLRIAYPREFEFIASRPLGAESNTVWKIDQLGQGEEGTIEINGILKGVPDENKVLEAFIETINPVNEERITFTSSREATQLVSSPLSLELIANDRENYNASLDQTIFYTLKFRNEFNVPLQEVFLKAQLVGSMFDVNSVRGTGSFNVTTNEMTWTALEVPELLSLDPQEEGEVEFTVDLKDRFPINSFNDKNFFVKVTGEIGTRVVPRFLGVDQVGQTATLVTKINTTSQLRAPGFYNDPTSGMSNSGPIPPEVGKDTTYTMHWQILNSSNDLNDVQVKAKLPTGVVWTGRSNITSGIGELSYNESTKEVLWDIGTVRATTGIALPVLEAVFQVKFSPSPSMAGRTAELLLESQLNGIDEYTGEAVSAFAPVVMSSLPDDTSIGQRQGAVKLTQ